MSFIAKNPLMLPEVPKPSVVPSLGTRGFFAGRDGMYEIDSYESIKKIATNKEILDSYKHYGNVGIFPTSSDLFSFFLNEDDMTATVSASVSDISGDVVIPYEHVVDGKAYAVTEIKEYGFSECSEITKVIIPSSVTQIGDNAFSNCSKLSNIIIPESVVSIGADAFSGCCEFTDIYYKGSQFMWSNITIGENSESLSYIIHYDYIPATKGDILEYLKPNDRDVFTVTMQGAIDENGEMQIGDISATLEEIIAQDKADKHVVLKLKFIDGWHVLGYPTEISETGIFASFIVHDGYRFNHKIICDAGTWRTEKLPDGSVDASIINKIERLQYYGDANIVPSDESLFDFFTYIDDNTASISLKQDANQDSIKELVIPYKYIDENGKEYKVTSAGVYAFGGCENLINVIIPSSLTRIGGSAFQDCWSLTSINLPDGTTQISDEMFLSCNSLTSVNIPDGVTTIDEKAFCYCYKLSNIAIPDSVTSIEDGAFYICKSLTSIIIPDSVTSIGDEVFYGCSEDLTIICNPGSTAEAYAKANGIKYAYDYIDPTTISGSGTGSGDMLQSVYDADGDGIVDNAKTIDGVSLDEIEEIIASASHNTFEYESFDEFQECNDIWGEQAKTGDIVLIDEDDFPYLFVTNSSLESNLGKDITKSYALDSLLSEGYFVSCGLRFEILSDKGLFSESISRKIVTDDEVLATAPYFSAEATKEYVAEQLANFNGGSANLSDIKYISEDEVDDITEPGIYLINFKEEESTNGTLVIDTPETFLIHLNGSVSSSNQLTTTTMIQAKLACDNLGENSGVKIRFYKTEFQNMDGMLIPTDIGWSEWKYIEDFGSSIAEIIDNLTSTDTDKALSANQGRILNDSKADKATTLAGYGIKDAYTKDEVNSKISSVYKYRGTVDISYFLPYLALGENVGDVYNIRKKTNLVLVHEYEIPEWRGRTFLMDKNNNFLNIYAPHDVNITDYLTEETVLYCPEKNIKICLKQYIDALGWRFTATKVDSGESIDLEDNEELTFTKYTLPNFSYNAGDNVAWTGYYWDVLSGTIDIDLSDYYTKDETDNIVNNAEQILDAKEGLHNKILDEKDETYEDAKYYSANATDKKIKEEIDSTIGDISSVLDRILTLQSQY